MLLSKPQTQRFWREWSSVVRREKWGPFEADQQRHALLNRAGFQSLTQVDKTKGFDRVLAELGRLRDNVSRTIETLPAEQVTLPAGAGKTQTLDTRGQRRRYLWLIRQHAAQLGGDPYAVAIARDKFGITAGLTTIEDLTTRQLHQLLMTLAARAHKKSAENSSLTSEETFDDQVDFLPSEGLEPETFAQPEPATADCPF